MSTGDPAISFALSADAYLNKFSETVPGVEGSLSEATGKHYSASINGIFSLPKLPEVGEYVPAEVNRGPWGYPLVR